MKAQIEARKRNLTARDAEGVEYKWAFWRDARAGLWFLEDHEGCERVLEGTWAESLPRIKTILENYGFTAGVS